MKRMTCTRHTLTDLKRLLEVVEDGDGKLSIVLAGHPKLGNDLRRPTMEEIGYRTDIFTLDGIAGSQREYLQWLLHVCTAGKLEPEMFSPPTRSTCWPVNSGPPSKCNGI